MHNTPSPKRSFQLRMVEAYTHNPKRFLMVRTKVDRFRADPWSEYVGTAGAPATGGDSGTYYANGTQELLLSQGHRISHLGHGDVGGPFHCVRRELTEQNFGPVHNRTVTNPSNAGSYNYRGRYYAQEPVVSDSDFPVPALQSDSTLDALGTTAISRVLPTNPLASAVQAVVEFKREGPPSLVGAELTKRRVQIARDAGSEYLNVQFGWVPLLNDVLAFADAAMNQDRQIAKFVEESGKLLHRRYSYPTDITSTTLTETGQYPQPSFKVGYWLSTGTRTTVTTVRTRRWFSGAFTYHLAPPGTIARAEQIAAKRFGTRLTPELLWNLTPWTWAADWIGNTGDVLRNLSAFHEDGLVMPYGYMMTEQQVTKSISLSGAVMKYGSKPVSCTQTFRTTRKQRRKATPFGFGLNPAGFSGRQWSILVALGLARGHGQMRYD